ncbi:MAG: DHHW family protein [Oscillospiraceae bacterium]
MIKNIKKYPVIIFFAVLLYLVSIADLFSPIEEFSDLENRKLQAFPSFSVKSLVENKYTPKVEDFTEDHFILRNYWISLKSISESLIGKRENNGIVYGKDGYMFTKYLVENTENQDKNIAAIKTFMDRHPDKNTTVMLIPTASAIEEYRNGYAPVFDASGMIEKAKTQLGKDFLDVQDVLYSHAKEGGEYVYYRTDHHWTSQGAFLGYEEYIKSIGRTPTPLASRGSPVNTDNFLGTHYSKAKSFNAVPDTLSYLPNTSTIDILGKTDSIYDLEKLSTRDKYAMFLRGNNSLSTVHGAKKDGGTILVIKDSFATCVVPCVTEEFETIDVLDMRFYVQSVDELIAKNDYDEILFLYNCETFDSDINLPKINMYN